MSSSISLVEISSSIGSQTILKRFYTEVYEHEFPDPDERESLENMANYLRLKAEGWFGSNNYHILLIMQDDQPIAGSITDYLAEANTGVIEFLLVAPECRGRGIAKQLLEFTEATLKKDAKNSLGRDLDLIVGEMNDPFKSGNVQDNLDPFVRALIWHNWGYQKLDFPYVQPALSTDQIPVYHLLLMGKIINVDYAKGIPAHLIKCIVHEYLRWAMRIEDPELCLEYQQMSRYLNNVDTVSITPLANYLGHDDTKPLFVQSVTDITHPDLNGVLNVYRNSFSEGQVTAHTDDFIAALSATNSKDAGYNYHLWALRPAPESAIEGMASFFTFADAGFGGYVTLAGALKGSGRVRLLLARIEEQMLKDGKNCHGWFIECEPQGQELIFEHLGFREIAVTYRQPPLAGQAIYELADAPILRLMYKDFGCNYTEPKLDCETFLNAVESIFCIVYHVENPRNSMFFQNIQQQVLDCQEGFFNLLGA